MSLGGPCRKIIWPPEGRDPQVENPGAESGRTGFRGTSASRAYCPCAWSPLGREGHQVVFPGRIQHLRSIDVDGVCVGGLLVAGLIWASSVVAFAVYLVTLQHFFPAWPLRLSSQTPTVLRTGKGFRLSVPASSLVSFLFLPVWSRNLCFYIIFFEVMV